MVKIRVDGKQTDYSSYNLKSNPFVGTVPQESVSFCVTREKEAETAWWTLNSALTGTSTHTIIVGGYGNRRAWFFNCGRGGIFNSV